MQKIAACLGAGGFIGSHMVRRLKEEGYWVRGVDLHPPLYSETAADDFVIADLRITQEAASAVDGMDEVYQFAADMGGCQYVFTGEHDAHIVHNSAMINLNVCEALKESKTKVFFSSSACIYPRHLQSQPEAVALREADAYPADPDSEYGWEKIFSEHVYSSYSRCHGLDVRIGRYHNIYGPETAYEGGREKAPASISRKVAQATDKVQVWGSGLQRRSFLYIDDCIEATRRLMHSDFRKPINIGSSESVSILDLWNMAIEISGKTLKVEHIERPVGVLGVVGRNSDNTLIEQVLGWKPEGRLRDGMEKTYAWILSQVS